jgi:hypothetical protein
MTPLVLQKGFRVPGLARRLSSTWPLPPPGLIPHQFQDQTQQGSSPDSAACLLLMPWASSYLHSQSLGTGRHPLVMTVEHRVPGLQAQSPTGARGETQLWVSQMWSWWAHGSVTTQNQSTLCLMEAAPSVVSSSREFPSVPPPSIFLCEPSYRWTKH